MQVSASRIPSPRRNRDGAVVRALASHQCGQGSIPGVDVICELNSHSGGVKLKNSHLFIYSYLFKFITFDAYFRPEGNSRPLQVVATQCMFNMQCALTYSSEKISQLTLWWLYAKLLTRIRATLHVTKTIRIQRAFVISLLFTDIYRERNGANTSFHTL